MIKYLCKIMMVLTIMGMNAPLQADPPKPSAGITQACLDKLSVMAKKLTGEDLEKIFKDGLWAQFKDCARTRGKWQEITNTCCTPLPNYNCKGCNCGENDECTAHCDCCWGDGTKC